MASKISKMATTLGKLGGRPKNDNRQASSTVKVQNRQASAKINTKTAKHGARGA